MCIIVNRSEAKADSMNIKKYLSDHFYFSEKLMGKLLSDCHSHSCGKKEWILEPGQISKDVFFIESGMVKIVYYKENKWVTHFFFLENSFVTSSESLFLAKKSTYGIETIEDSQLVGIPFQLIEDIAQSSIEMNKIIQQILTHNLIAFSRRLTSLQFESASDRYQYLLDTNPEIIKRAPLGDIASYLGISQQTLSVIRSQVK